jgi:hypothetical protein
LIQFYFPGNFIKNSAAIDFKYGIIVAGKLKMHSTAGQKATGTKKQENSGVFYSSFLNKD